MKDKDKIIAILESYQDAIEDNGSAFWDSIREEYTDRILAIQEEEAKERYEEALNFLISPEAAIYSASTKLNEALRIAAGLEPTK